MGGLTSPSNFKSPQWKIEIRIIQIAVTEGKTCCMGFLSHRLLQFVLFQAIKRESNNYFLLDFFAPKIIMELQKIANCKYKIKYKMLAKVFKLKNCHKDVFE